jgi:hypothetical protein
VEASCFSKNTGSADALVRNPPGRTGGHQDRKGSRLHRVGWHDICHRHPSAEITGTDQNANDPGQNQRAGVDRQQLAAGRDRKRWAGNL